MKRSEVVLKLQVILFVLVLLLLVGVTILLSIFVYFNLFSTEKSSNQNEVFEYKSLHLNPSTNEITVGFSTLSRQLVHDEFVSYQDGNWYTLISNLGASEYMCTGICYCEEDIHGERRMSSSGIMPRSILTYLVAAMSSYLAIQIAKDHFTEECLRKLSDHCPLESVKSEETDCSELDCEDLDDLHISDPTERVTIENLKGDYICKGYCIPEDDKKLDFVNEYCETKWISSSFDFDPEKMYGNSLTMALDHFNVESFSPSEIASLMFAETTVDPYCKENSKEITEEEMSQMSEEIKKVVRNKINRFVSEKSENSHFCRGIVQGIGGIFSRDYILHKKTKCRKLLDEEKLLFIK